jgi:hypothetical protein
VLIGLPVYAGILLVELSFEDPSWARRVHAAPFILVIVGLYLGCYPEVRAETASWSTQLQKVGHFIFPSGTELPRALPTLGGIIVILGVVVSRSMQEALSGSLLVRLGKISFALYLLHGTLLKSVLIWMLWLAGYREKEFTSIYHLQVIVDRNNVSIVQQPADMRLSIPGVLGALCVLPLWWYVVFYICHLWAGYVEPRCAALTDWIDSKAFSEKDCISGKATLPIAKSNRV